MVRGRKPGVGCKYGKSPQGFCMVKGWPANKKKPCKYGQHVHQGKAYCYGRPRGIGLKKRTYMKHDPTFTPSQKRTQRRIFKMMQAQSAAE